MFVKNIYVQALLGLFLKKIKKQDCPAFYKLFKPSNISFSISL